MTFTHTASCLAYQQRLQDAIDAYTKAWPNFCIHCGGCGEVHWVENASPLGSGENWPKDEGDVCSQCFEKGICPRCGKQAWTDEQLGQDPVVPCPHCGWTYGKTPGFPPAFEGDCGCYDAEIDKAIQDSEWDTELEHDVHAMHEELDNE